MIKKIGLYYRTIKYLKPVQAKYRLWYLLRGKFRKLTGQNYPLAISKQSYPLQLKPPLPKPSTFNLQPATQFTFLNQTKTFEKGIDWNYPGYGKLWAYNLNYFDYLHQPEMDEHKGLSLIHAFIKQIDSNREGMEPYPISLRGINWIKFMSLHGIRDEQIDASLYAQYLILTDNLEYHLMGNHLLENGLSLLFGAYYFRDEMFYKNGKSILESELEEQILEDGGHFERSPMYHQILLDRLLDCINLLQHNVWKKDELQELLEAKADLMLGWLKKMTFSDGTIPIVNDSVAGIAPDSQSLIKYADRLNINSHTTKLSASGYRKLMNDQIELVVDVGNIGPDYIPGHAHSDTLSFVLFCYGEPIIVDPGISTYEKNGRRKLERSTIYHNTVMINGMEQSEVWGGFRVGRRAQVSISNDSDSKIKASHNGYQKWGINHQRTWKLDDKGLIIKDEVYNPGKVKNAVAYLHFHPEITVRKIYSYIEAGELNFSFSGETDWHLEEYEYCVGFNSRVTAQKVAIRFQKELTTTITL